MELLRFQSFSSFSPLWFLLCFEFVAVRFPTHISTLLWIPLVFGNDLETRMQTDSLKYSGVSWGRVPYPRPHPAPEK